MKQPEFSLWAGVPTSGKIFCGVELGGKNARREFSKKLAAAGYENRDLTDNDLAKTHLRYMIGGRSAQASNEKLYRFWFPERSGALSRFLADMGANWNISLFHYRSSGGEFGRVLIGLELPDKESRRLNNFLKRLGYSYQEVSADPAYQLFL